MRRLITALLTCTVLILSLAATAGASAQATQHRPWVSQAPQYVCDGDGAGICMSLPAKGTEYVREPLISLGVDAGAWRWDALEQGTVGQPGFQFSYGPLENQLQNQPVYAFALYASSGWCAANSAGGAVLNACSYAPDQLWVFDPTNHYLVNMGRSNDQDNWEVLCNPGAQDPLVIGTRDSCSTYHEQWALTG